MTASFTDTVGAMAAPLARVPKVWQGRRAIMQMRNADYPHWRQMEWIGFYFQFLCGKHLAGIVEMPGPKYGNSEFDGFLGVPWDFKAHAMNTSSHTVIVNDSAAIAQGIKDYGAVGVVLAMGKVKYNDEERTLQKWHDELKGEQSAYVKQRIERGAWSRLRKVSFRLQQISFIRITDKTLVRCGSFQRDFRNADGKPRKEKVLLDLEKLDDEVVRFVEF